MGSFEMFRIAPLKVTHVLLGKTLAFSLYVLIAGSALTALLRLLQVPFLGSPLVFVALLVLLTLASVGIGMLISAISTSDSQAVQLTMLTLLLSIFFTGFFLPKQGFLWPARPIGAVLPMSYGLTGLQNIMLLGRTPGIEIWFGLAALALGAFALVLLVMRRVYRGVIS
jgi:ABC-2 type transport system permease protein